jgi:hypothetical protein
VRGIIDVAGGRVDVLPAPVPPAGIWSSRTELRRHDDASEHVAEDEHLDDLLLALGGAVAEGGRRR